MLGLLGHWIFTHDLSIIKTIADEVAVMREGKIVEQGCVEKVMNSPKSK